MKYDFDTLCLGKIWACGDRSLVVMTARYNCDGLVGPLGVMLCAPHASAAMDLVRGKYILGTSMMQRTEDLCADSLLHHTYIDLASWELRGSD